MKNLTFSISIKSKLILACLLIGNLSFAQKATNPWKTVKERSIKSDKTKRHIHPLKYNVMSLDVAALKATLSSTKLQSDNTKSADIIISIPNPEGGFSDYKVYKNTTMHADLEANFSEIRTYNAVNVANKSEVVKLDITPHGFHAMILSPDRNTIFIDPYIKGDIDNYQIYYKKDYSSNKESLCEFSEHVPDLKGGPTNKSFGSCELRTYRLALACTGEYANAVGGGTVSGALAAQVTTMNRVNGVYERDIAVTMTIIGNNNVLIYTNQNTDPYTNSTGFLMLGENQANVNALIGSANYDIGHVFSTGGGGVAGFGVVCSSSSKARGVTGSSNPQGDSFDIDFVAHEMGHQFRGSHTFNGDQGSCNGNRSNSTAYETGSGTTIMGYAGICGADNVQANSDALFHGISLEEIGNFITTTGNTCAVKTPLTNTAPTLVSTNIDGSITIPASTPFMLTATASDPDGDALTYTWEQFDKQISAQPPLSTSPVGPNFRAFDVSSSPTRYFPELFRLTIGASTIWEVLPSISRVLNFRVVVRDNSTGGGCNDHSDVSVNVDGNSGPFLVTNPTTTGITWVRYTNETVTWDPAGTAGSPVSCANVDILLSKDAGLTYPITLASNVPNDGSETISVPNQATTLARVIVVCENGTFFDISDKNFTIVNFPVGVDEVQSNQSISSYFNDNKIELSLTNIAKGTYDFHIVNSLGQEIMDEKINVNSDDEKMAIPFNGDASGIYYISISNDKGRYNSKFFK